MERLIDHLERHARQHPEDRVAVARIAVFAFRSMVAEGEVTAADNHGQGRLIDDGGRATDPTCGRIVEMDTATVVAVHDGRAYYFCSAACAKYFEEEDMGRSQ